jgi:2-oxoglutarate dehydrogenase E2 component (dihydrolipoamide succinyltransferase)
VESAEPLRAEEREALSPLRQKLSQRLVSVKNETAMLTTFNEVDMTELQRIRSTYGSSFEAQHGVKLGLMAFFTMAATRALLEFPKVNAFIEGDEIVYHPYTDISIAVSAPKGLLVPVVRNTQALDMAGTEQEIRRLAAKARDNRLTLDEMSGGTFTITNGGVFGSMLSTPILNPPQSAILGLHNIVDRPVAISGRVEIRPIMYVALSYDHRIIDGRESVGFLKRIKELIESPHLLTTERDPYQELLGL